MKRKGTIIIFLCIFIASATLIYWGLIIENDGSNTNQPPVINSYYPLVNPYILKEVFSKKD